MKAQELRIGNIVYQVSRSNAVNLPLPFAMQVWQIGIFNSEILTTDERPESAEFIKVANTDLSPIPLTPEWLEKFGFIRQADLVENKVWLPNGGSGQFHGAEIFRNESYQDVYLDENVFHFILAQDDNQISINYTSVEIKYVHQLQNISFALTGEELEIKEPATK